MNKFQEIALSFEQDKPAPKTSSEKSKPDKKDEFDSNKPKIIGRIWAQLKEETVKISFAIFNFLNLL